MPRYFFHIHDDMDVPDDEGLALPSLEDAREHAVREARILVAEAAKENGRVILAHRIDIEDVSGAVLASVRFGDAVQIED